MLALSSNGAIIILWLPVISGHPSLSFLSCGSPEECPGKEPGFLYLDTCVNLSTSHSEVNSSLLLLS